MLRLVPLLLVLTDLGTCYHSSQSTTLPPTTTPNSIPFTTVLPQTPVVNVNNYANSGYVDSPSTTLSSNFNIQSLPATVNIAKSPFKSNGAGNNKHGSKVYTANPQIQPLVDSRSAFVDNNLNSAQLQLQQQSNANSQFQAPVGNFPLQTLVGNPQVQSLGNTFQNQALVGNFPLQNPQLQNPQLQNPQLQNPQLQNPQLEIPQVQNPLQNSQFQEFGANSQAQPVSGNPNFRGSTENVLLASLIGNYPSQPFPIIRQQNANNVQPQSINPQVQGFNTNPQLQALIGNPQIQALNGNPQLQALGGNPQLQALGGNPQLQALGGNPQLQALGGNPQLQALGGNPQLQALRGNPQLQALGGNPQLQALRGNAQMQSSLALNNLKRLNINSFNTPSQAPIVNANLNPSSPTPSPNFANRGLDVAFQWRYLDWVHPTVQLTGKNFTVGNPLSQDVDIDSRGRVFVTSPQWLEGTPITLSVVTDLKGEGGPLLTPYPDWTWHRQDCNSLISVYRIAIDECNRIWIIDTGTASGTRICPVKLLAFDLKTDQLVQQYQIPEDQIVVGTSYVNPVVEVGDSCQDSFVYIADVIGHGLLIYSLRENRSWRLGNTRNNAFGLDPEATSLTIAGETIQLNDGTLGLALTPRGLFTKRYLYFNSLASFYQKFADTDSLKRSFVYEPIMYQSVAKRVSQAGAHAMSKTGALFFQLAQFTALACWNVERPFVPENVVVLAQDSETLQYISGIKVVTNSFGEEELWFNTNRLQKTINKSRKINEVNFRLIRGKVEDLIRGTRCAPSGLRVTEPNLQGWKRI